jgi:type III pantothenate kinase
VIESGGTGVLVPPRDPAALAEALTRLLTDPAQRRRLADAAFERLAPFRIETVAGQVAELYERLTAEASR